MLYSIQSLLVELLLSTAFDLSNSDPSIDNSFIDSQFYSSNNIENNLYNKPLNDNLMPTSCASDGTKSQDLAFYLMQNYSR